MNIRIGFLKLASFTLVAAAAVAPAAAHAQSVQNRGQLVQAIVKLNNAQLAFAKRLAEDAQFASQFDKATTSGNYDAAASLAASATGLAKSNIHVGLGAPAGDDDHHDVASASTTTSLYSLASFSPRRERKMTSGKICFDVVIAQGCIAW